MPNKQIFSLKKGLVYGGVAGFIAGIVMSVVMSIGTSLNGISYEIILQSLALLFVPSEKNLAQIGLILHLATSTSIGLIFGLFTTKSKTLRIFGFKKGVYEGIIAGTIAFVILSIPMNLAFVPPILSDIIAQGNPEITADMVLSNMKNTVFQNLLISFIYHMIFGITLGLIYTIFAKKHLPLFKIQSN
jgi:hypothetical protein